MRERERVDGSGGALGAGGGGRGGGEGGGGKARGARRGEGWRPATREERVGKREEEGPGEPVLFLIEIKVSFFLQRTTGVGSELPRIVASSFPPFFLLFVKSVVSIFVIRLHFIVHFQIGRLLVRDVRFRIGRQQEKQVDCPI